MRTGGCPSPSASCKVEVSIWPHAAWGLGFLTDSSSGEGGRHHECRLHDHGPELKFSRQIQIHLADSQLLSLLCLLLSTGSNPGHGYCFLNNNNNKSTFFLSLFEGRGPSTWVICPVLPGTLTGSWNRNGAAHTGSQRCRQQFNLLCHNANPKTWDLNPGLAALWAFHYTKSTARACTIKQFQQFVEN